MNEPLTLPFQTFWSWLVAHPNCILRAGTPEAVLYDDEDLHWHFGSENDRTLLVQVLRGKRYVGELLVEPEQVTYVQAEPGEQEGETVFELIAESDTDRVAVWFFVLSHGYDGDAVGASPSRAHIH